MKIIIRPHLKLRLKQREIPQNYPRMILDKPGDKYYDNQTDHLIAIKPLKYYGKTRPMVAAYDIIGENIQVITVHPTSEKEIKNRVKNGRWIKNEKN